MGTAAAKTERSPAEAAGAKKTIAASLQPVTKMASMQQPLRGAASKASQQTVRGSMPVSQSTVHCRGAASHVLATLVATLPRPDRSPRSAIAWADEALDASRGVQTGGPSPHGLRASRFAVLCPWRTLRSAPLHPPLHGYSHDRRVRLRAPTYNAVCRAMTDADRADCAPTKHSAESEQRLACASVLGERERTVHVRIHVRAPSRACVTPTI